MTTRPAAETDVDDLLALEVRAFGVQAWSRRLVRDAVPDAVVLTQGGGWAVLSVAGDIADLQRIAVDRRRAGLGRVLLDAALDRATRAGADRVLLEVREDNAPARAFYAAAGFAEIDRRRGYYRDGADALVLARGLGG